MGLHWEKSLAPEMGVASDVFVFLDLFEVILALHRTC